MAVEDGPSLNELTRRFLVALPALHCDKNVGRRIRDRRKELGLSQGDLSSISCSLGYVSKIEIGKSQPSLSVLLGIALALGTSPVYLASGHEPTALTYEQEDLCLMMLGIQAEDLRPFQEQLRLLRERIRSPVTEEEP